MSLLPPEGTVPKDMVDHLFYFFAITECCVHDASLRECEHIMQGYSSALDQDNKVHRAMN